MKNSRICWIFAIVLIFAGLGLGGCGKKAEVQAVPRELQDKTFVYDQLETGEGSSLYTLRFSETGFSLFRDGGTGILAEGTVRKEENSSLTFLSGDGEFSGRFSGGTFHEPSLSMESPYGSFSMVPATETTEYVYQSWLGVYEGQAGDAPVLLILERWQEFYLCVDGQLTRGIYDIYSDHTLRLTPYEGKPVEARVEYPEDQSFDPGKVNIHLPLNGETGILRPAVPEGIYEAAHAMGTYTLSVYGQNVFTIRGVDGFLKSFGTLDKGKAVYFPRKMTGEAENGSSFHVPFTMQEDVLSFPDSTPLLPRSGNLNEQTGLGEYWNAGTELEFIRRQETADPNAGILFADSALPYGVSGGNFPDTVRGLEQVMPSVGTARPLVLLVDFPDFHRPRHVTAEAMEEALFSLEDPNSLSSFYYRSSYGQLVIDGTVLPWYRASRERDAYESDYALMAEVIGHFRKEGLDLSRFDSDGDGAIDSLYVLWAGNLSGQDGIWNVAYRSSWDSSPEEWEKRVSGYIFVPGSTVWSLVPPLRCNTNSLIHESGHLLGLNDYYSYDTHPRSDAAYPGFTGGALEGGMAGMDMMDANIGDHNAFSKWLLGWLEPQVVEYEDISSLDGKTFRLRPSALAPEALFVKLRSSDSLNTELLVIEAVAPAGNAAEYSRLHEPVVRILHVDAAPEASGLTGNWRGYGFANDNSYTTTKFISVLEADGQDTFLGYLPGPGGVKPSYSGADYFKAGDWLNSDTYPSTDRYDAYGNASIPTGVEIEIVSIAPDGTAELRLSCREPGKRLNLLSVTPEPQIVPYPKDQPTLVPEGTLQLVFTYDAPLEKADLSAVQILRDQKPLEGTTAEISGSSLVITLPEPMNSGESTTVLIPQGTLHSQESPEIYDHSSRIYGFAG